MDRCMGCSQENCERKNPLWVFLSHPSTLPPPYPGGGYVRGPETDDGHATSGA